MFTNNSCKSRVAGSGSLDLPVDTLDKEARKQIHGLVKLLNLASETVTANNGQKLIKVTVAKSKGGGRGDVKRGERGRSREEKFLHFSMYKENLGTAECISRLAKQIRTQVGMNIYCT